MSPRYQGPRLWLDQKRGTWTILDGYKRIRTGCTDRQQAEKILHHHTSDALHLAYRPAGPQPRRTTPQRTGIYVAGFGSYIKIGVAIDIDQRLIDLQTPEKMELYAVIPGWLFEERALHRKFADYRLNGEWFRREGTLSDWIAAGCPHA